MGNAVITSTGRDDEFDVIDALGYRVLGVQPDSLALRTGLVSFLDFIFGANGGMLFSNGMEWTRIAWCRGRNRIPAYAKEFPQIDNKPFGRKKSAMDGHRYRCSGTATLRC